VKTLPTSIVDWRYDQLVYAGVPLGLADAVASMDRYDVHELISLLERGCEPALAVKILAPLEENAIGS
jgi:hypothetical protein